MDRQWILVKLRQKVDAVSLMSLEQKEVNPDVTGKREGLNPFFCKNKGQRPMGTSSETGDRGRV